MKIGANQLDADAEVRAVARAIHLHFLEWVEPRYQTGRRHGSPDTRGDFLRGMVKLQAAGHLDEGFELTEAGWKDLVDAGLAVRDDQEPSRDPDPPAPPTG